jgi:N,N'-diacetyllegionaminate synthase
MLFVAEIGMNHDGNFDLAYELIRQARQAGADIAKFQFGWRDKPGEINQIDEARARQLRDWCGYWGIEMMASLMTREAFEMARRVGFARYKIASRTALDNPELCRAIIAERHETFVSLGMSEAGTFPFGPPSERLRYIYCRSKYPSYPADLRAFPESFSENGWYGYSDHQHGVEACLLAVARGAQYIEKHFTLNRTSQVIRDHVLSATPPEFSELTRHGDALSRLVMAIRPSA